MAKFCRRCGKAIGEDIRFCAGCGTQVTASQDAEPMPVAPPSPAKSAVPAPPNDLAHPADAYSRKKPVLPFAVGAAVIGLVITAYWAWQNGWMSNYDDHYLSGDMTVFVTGPANRRDLPTSEDSEPLDQLFAGASLSGRWVSGVDPSTRWFKIDDGGYIWDGNLSAAYPDEPETPYLLEGYSCQGERCAMYHENGMKPTETVKLLAQIGSPLTIGEASEGQIVRVLESKVLVKQEGEAVVLCDGYRDSDRVFQRGTPVTPVAYIGEGYVNVIASRNGRRTHYSIDMSCLGSNRDYIAEDWLKVETADGMKGWVTPEKFEPIFYDQAL